MQPKTHWPSTTCPVWYFLFPILLSSICTSFPGPPIFSRFSESVTSHTSLQKISQSTAACEPIPSCFFYLPLIQILAPPVRKFHDFFQCHVCTLEPASFSNTSLTPVRLSMYLFPALPDVTIGSITTSFPFHIYLHIISYHKYHRFCSMQ